MSQADEGAPKPAGSASRKSPPPPPCDSKVGTAPPTDDSLFASDAAKSENPRLAALRSKREALEATLSALLAERTTLVDKLPTGLVGCESTPTSDNQKAQTGLAAANAVVKKHIELLHRYNEIKDIGQGLMGLIAENRGVRVREVMEDMGIDEKD